MSPHSSPERALFFSLFGEDQRPDPGDGGNRAYYLVYINYICLGNTPQGESTPYDGLYEEAPPERGTLFKLQVYERVGISLVEVYERVGKSVIWVCEGVQKG